MRSLALLIGVLVLASCASAPVPRQEAAAHQFTQCDR